MIWDVAEVTDCGNSYRVDSVIKNTKIHLREGSLYIDISNIAAAKIREEKEKGNDVYIPKGLTDEVSVFDLIINETDELNKAKFIAELKAKQKIDGLMAKFSAFDFFNFTVSSNVLASKGFFITADNREEKYIEIINAGDPELIVALEEYLDAYDKISLPNRLYQKFLDYRTAVRNAGSPEDVEKLERDYLK